MDVEYQRYGLVGDWREWHNLCESGQELWAEVALHNIHQLVVLGYHAAVKLLYDVLGTDVRCEQDECIREVAHTAQSVVQLTLVEYL